MIASLTTLCGLYDLALLGVPHLPGINQGLEEYIIQGTWLPAIGISQIINGISTFRGKAWPWRKIVTLQFVAIVPWTISLIAFFSNPPSFDENAQAVVIAPLLLILIQIIISTLVLLYLFTLKGRLYLGKSNFSIRRLVVADMKGV